MDKITNPVIAEIYERAKAKGLTLTGLAKKAGLNSKTLTAKANTTGGPQTRTLQAVARVLGCEVADLLQSAATTPKVTGDVAPAPVSIRRVKTTGRKDLPVHGTAAGSALNGFEISPGTIEYVHRPPGLDGVDEAYAIYVVSASMSPRHNPGDLCFIHPHRMFRAGDSVIIQIQIHPGAPIEAYIKTFMRETSTEIIAEQINPQATLRYKKGTVIAIHKVMTMNDLFGV